MKFRRNVLCKAREGVGSRQELYTYLLEGKFFFKMQPSRSNDDSDKFFGCKAYLTVSGQLQAEALARYVV